MRFGASTMQYRNLIVEALRLIVAVLSFSVEVAMPQH